MDSCSFPHCIAHPMARSRSRSRGRQQEQEKSRGRSPPSQNRGGRPPTRTGQQSFTCAVCNDPSQSFYRAYRSRGCCKKCHAGVRAHNTVLSVPDDEEKQTKIMKHFDNLCDNKVDEWVKSVIRFCGCRSVGLRQNLVDEMEDLHSIEPHPSALALTYGSGVPFLLL